MKRFSLLKLGVLTAGAVCLLPPATVADEIDKKTVVTFDQPTEVPGIVLQPGKYVIRLLNSSSNRHIAEIMNERMDHLYTLTFTAAAERVGPLTDEQNKRILTFYEGKNGQPQAVRRWFWPGETIGQEFLYPKDQAAKIASRTNEKVSEGNLPTVAESGQSLTPDSAQAVTLQSSDESKPVAAPVVAVAVEPAPELVVIAQNTPAPPATRPADIPEPTPAAAPYVPPSPSTTLAAETVASNNNSLDQTLPQTASSLPLLGAIGILALASATLLAFARRHRSL